MTDSSGISYAREAKIQTRLSLDKKRLWSKAQLAHELQCIFAKRRLNSMVRPFVRRALRCWVAVTSERGD